MPDHGYDSDGKQVPYVEVCDDNGSVLVFEHMLPPQPPVATWDEFCMQVESFVATLDAPLGSESKLKK